MSRLVTDRMINERWTVVEMELAGETEVVQENLSQCHIAHKNPHITWPEVVADATTLFA
jgi:hypothetical protein